MALLLSLYHCFFLIKQPKTADSLLVFSIASFENELRRCYPTFYFAIVCIMESSYSCFRTPKLQTHSNIYFFRHSPITLFLFRSLFIPLQELYHSI